MYINSAVIHGIEYATVVESYRNGQSVQKQKIRYLGRILLRIGEDGEIIKPDSQNDESNSGFSAGVFKNSKDGTFFYNIHDEGSGHEIQEVPREYTVPTVRRKNAVPIRPERVFTFGNVYLLDIFIHRCGMSRAIDALRYRNSDTLYTLVGYYILGSLANCYALDWWERSYARFLYPNANVASQRISEVLVDIGSEHAKQCFFEEYFTLVGHSSNPSPLMAQGNRKPLKYVVDDGILIDSTGLPNSCHLPVTAINNHNGVISKEIRLIYVIQQHTGLPLFYRYVPGNVIDASTIKKVVIELKSYNVNTKWAILDAGYYNGKNADALLDAGISFVTRVKSSAKIFKDAVKEYRSVLESRENAVQHNGRLLYIKAIPCKIGSKANRDAYAYLCLDITERNAQIDRLLNKAMDEELSDAEVHDETISKGLFMLVATRRLSKEEVINLYYTRDQVEKIFEICKQNGNILPIRIETEEALRGHLMLSFIATVVVKLMRDTLANTKYHIDFALWLLGTLSVIMRNNLLIVSDVDKKIREVFEAFAIECPDTIQIPLSVD